MSRIIPQGPKRILALGIVIFSVCLGALALAASGHAATPAPSNFPFVTTMSTTPTCVNVGQIFMVQLTVTNTGKPRAWANITVQGLGNNEYSFSEVSSQPALQSNTQSYTEPGGQAYSWTSYSWQGAIKGSKSAVFNLMVKVPDWNVQQPPYTGPDGQVYPAPPPQPYPLALSFSVGLAQYEVPTRYESFNVPYCGEPLPVGSGGK